MNRQLASFLSTPAFNRAWRMRREFHGEEFRRMDDVLPAVAYRMGEPAPD